MFYAIFGGDRPNSKTLRENTRKQEREIHVQIRKLDREIAEKKIKESIAIRTLKNLANEKQYDKAVLTAKARELATLRAQTASLYSTKSRLASITSQLSNAKCAQSVVTATEGTANVISNVNASISMPRVQRTLSVYKRSYDALSDKTELLNDAIDSADVPDMGEDDETDDIVNRILDEMNIKVEEELSKAPSVSCGQCGTYQSQNGADGRSNDSTYYPRSEENFQRPMTRNVRVICPNCRVSMTPDPTKAQSRMLNGEGHPSRTELVIATEEEGQQETKELLERLQRLSPSRSKLRYDK